MVRWRAEKLRGRVEPFRAAICRWICHALFAGVESLLQGGRRADVHCADPTPPTQAAPCDPRRATMPRRARVHRPPLIGDMLVQCGVRRPGDGHGRSSRWNTANAGCYGVTTCGRWALPTPCAGRARAADAATAGDIAVQRRLTPDAARRWADSDPASRVVYGHAWKVAAAKTIEGHGIVRIDDIRRGPRT